MDTRLPLPSRSLYLVSFAAMLLVLSAGCGSKRNLVYFSDLPDSAVYRADIVNQIEPTIQAGDILRITVNSLNAETNMLFNTGAMVAAGEERRTTAEADLVSEGYLVNEAGYITFPVIGQVLLEGLTREQARQKLVSEVSQYAKDPIINIRLVNFKITVVGEVHRPSTFAVPNEKINIVEALGMAGDMTEFGQRENVLVIREKHGQRSMVRLNLNEKEAFNSPYFYLQQNDVVYVEPSRYRDPSGERTMRILSVVFSGLTALGLFIWRVF